MKISQPGRLNSHACRGQRVVYTTPLKALSNQKLYEFRRKFGVLRVGLQTGDASLNAQGDIVIMTTEVMRNIMYRGAHDAQTGAQPRFAHGTRMHPRM